MAVCWAASQGNMTELIRLVAEGYDLKDADYDVRTAMHLAASEGQNDALEFLIAKNVNVNPKDRLGGTHQNSGAFEKAWWSQLIVPKP